MGRWKDKHRDTYRKLGKDSDGDKEPGTCKDTNIK